MSYRRAWQTLAALLLMACAACSLTPSPAPTTPSPAAATQTPPALESTLNTSPVSAPSSTPALPPSATPTLAPPGVWFSPALPAALREAALPAGYESVSSRETSLTQVEILPKGETVATPIVHWVLALAAPFYTLTDNISATELLSFWQGQATGAFLERTLLLSQEMFDLLSAWWGAPASGAALQIAPAADLLNAAWNSAPSAWAILPFEALSPQWKVLRLDGLSPLDKDFSAPDYALSVPVSLSGDYDLAVVALLFSNRQAERFTVVVMTGVTALVRATAWTMFMKGILYPGEDIRNWLNAADITHISNEVPFDPTCPPRADPAQAGLVFCTPPDYIALLEDMGADVIEVTGDHFIDRGPQATLGTLEMYRQRGWQYYGGGDNLPDGQRAATFEHNGNKIAFIGCNAKGGGYATAKADYPGAAACDFDILHKEVVRLSAEGYLVIATFQHHEVYSYVVTPEDRLDYLGMADAGAVIVQGSQAHQPQNFEFYKGAFIHYGPGNLFFDQYKEVNVAGEFIADRAFIDRHIFYNGRYISAELLPVKFVDFAKPRPMTAEESAAFRSLMFAASGWTPAP